MVPAVKRVPILLVIPIAVGVVALPWWYWTKDMDFLKAPNELQLVAIRDSTAASFSKRAPVFSVEAEREQAKVFQSPIKAAPVINPGDVHAPASLDAFREHATHGAQAFVELAVHLEEQSGNARALLAWERVLDVCRPGDSQRAAALSGIERLKPLVAPWNIDPQAEIPMVLEATLSGNVPIEGLDVLLASCATALGKQSSGLLKFESQLTQPQAKPPPKDAKAKGKQKPAPKPVPVAPVSGPAVLSLQILGKGESAASTGLTELTLSSPPDEMRREIFTAIYRLVSSQLAATTDFTPPLPLAAGDEPEATLGTRVTRLCWAEFGKSLQAANPP